MKGVNQVFLFVLEWNVNWLSLFLQTEYCERYAKKENIANSKNDEESDEDDISDGRCTSSDDEIPGLEDSWMDVYFSQCNIYAHQVISFYLLSLC